MDIPVYGNLKIVSVFACIPHRKNRSCVCFRHRPYGSLIPNLVRVFQQNGICAGIRGSCKEIRPNRQDYHSGKESFYFPLHMLILLGGAGECPPRVVMFADRNTRA